MEMQKLFRGTETEIAEAMTAFYNRQGRIGNHPGNAKILIYEDKSIGVAVPVRGDIIDDGRQIDDIEDRKSFLLYRTSGTDTTPVDQFIKDHTEAGDDISRPFICPVGNDTLYFIAACKVVRVADPWATQSDDDSDDWQASGTPTVEKVSDSGFTLVPDSESENSDILN